MFDFEIQHRKGGKHTNADGLSRRPFRKYKRESCPNCLVDPETCENAQKVDQNI